MKTLKTEGIVLRKNNLPNEDFMIHLFSKEKGKLVVAAKGIKKITSRRSPHIQTGNLINAVIYNKNERFYLQETSLISGFTEIKKDHGKINDLYLILFLVERLAPENQVEPLLYQLIKKFLIELSRSKKSKSITTKYMNKILMILGFLHEERSFDELQVIIEDIINEKLPRFDI